jgi:cellulose synthase/poly-beta-1,6-N-acetylglucosamine synthase-like glycosyltransferase
MGRLGLWLFLGYLGLSVVMNWLILMAAWRRDKRFRVEPLRFKSDLDLFIVAPCHNAAGSIPELVHDLKRQEYPKDRYKILILADNCTDDSAKVARSLDVDVYVRDDKTNIGKGYGLNELLEKRLRQETFDALVLLDIDARVDPQFLRVVSRHLANGAQVVQGATCSKNPNESLLAHVGDIIQSLVRRHQEGRRALGLLPWVIGSHGIALTKPSLSRLDWRIATGQTSDDLELALRCFLRSVAVQYAPDWHVVNDLAASSHAVRMQRRRWTHVNHEVFPKYIGPFVRRLLAGDWRAGETFFGLVLTPSFSNLFLLLVSSVLLLSIWTVRYPESLTLLRLALVLLCLDIGYFLTFFAWEGWAIRLKDLRGFVRYLFLRAIATVDSFFHWRSKKWAPAPHATPPIQSSAQSEAVVSRHGSY